MATARNSTHLSPPSLHSLPREVLDHISLSLDRRTSAALSLTCHALRPAALQRLYRDLDVFLNPSYGLCPSTECEMGPLVGDAAAEPADRDEAAAVEPVRRRGLNKRVRRMMVEGGEILRTAVKKVTVQAVPGTADGIVQLLHMLSSSIQELVFLPTFYNDYVFYEDRFGIPDSDTIDLHFIGSGLSFPSLRHIRIELFGIRFAEFVFLLLEAAPNLVSLDVDVQQELLELYNGERGDDIETFPEVPAVVNIQQLRVRFTDRVNNTIETDDERTKWEHAHPMFLLLSRCQVLRPLSIDYEDSGSDSWLYMFEPIAQAISRLPKLEDLHWWVGGKDICNAVENVEGYFPALRRIVVQSGSQIHMFRDFSEIHLPKLEAVYFDNRRSLRRRIGLPKDDHPPYNHPLGTVALRMLPETAEYLRRHPFLSIAHPLSHPDDDVFAQLDRIEQDGKPHGFIRSYTHGDTELLHVRRLAEWAEQSDTPSEAPSSSTSGFRVVAYTTETGEKRCKSYKLGSTPKWEDSTDLDGLCVPLDILHKMRRVQGASLGQWERRGVQLGDAAWAILMAWKESQEV